TEQGIDPEIEYDLHDNTARHLVIHNEERALACCRIHARVTRDRFKTRGKACSMCGDFCAMELAEKHLGVSVSRC
ncbi:phosphomethylpyrimidine synthase, partial [Dehalococcoides mccartyi]